MVRFVSLLLVGVVAVASQAGAQLAGLDSQLLEPPAAGGQAREVLEDNIRPIPQETPKTAQTTPKPAEEPPPPTLKKDIAVLQMLDKVAGRTTTLRVPVNTGGDFGLLHLVVRACRVSAPSVAPESTVFLEISEAEGADPYRPRALLFSGWMFASSPALSSLEHPVYDVTLLGCEDKPIINPARGNNKAAPAASATPPAAPAGADEAPAAPQD